MKPSLQSLRSNTADSSFSSYWVNAPQFGFHWHYHPEIELCYVHRGAGTRMVGDSVREFSAGDLVLLGPNLPHTWMSRPDANHTADTMQVYVIQFLPILLPPALLDLPEFAPIADLLRRASRGVFFNGGNQYATQFGQLAEANGVDKFARLLGILADLSGEPATDVLASQNHSPVLSPQNEKRMQAVFGYIHAHFTSEITLGQTADIACMNEASFCRYFRKTTGQTLTSYINDLRVSRACQLLTETKLSIAAIAQMVGFNSFTNFNKSFTKRKRYVPGEYRRKTAQ